MTCRVLSAELGIAPSLGNRIPCPREYGNVLKPAQLGRNSGLRVWPLYLGTMNFGKPGRGIGATGPSDATMPDLGVPEPLLHNLGVKVRGEGQTN
jgi:hypothetical protein